MTGLARSFVCVLAMDLAARGGGVRLMAVRAGRLSRCAVLAGRFRTVSVEFPLLMAGEAIHPFFKMDVPHAVFGPHELGVYPPTVAGRTGFGFVLLLETVVGEKPLIDAGNDRGLDVAVAAGSVAGPA